MASYPHWSVPFQALCDAKENVNSMQLNASIVCIISAKELYAEDNYPIFDALVLDNYDLTMVLG